MNYRNLGRTGLKISPLCLGCMTYGVPERGNHPWTLPEDQSQPLLKKALDLGINFFDTANSYSDGTSEEIVGRFLKANAVREEIVLATKVYFPLRDKPNVGGLSRKAIFAAIDASLQRLGTDYVDLYQIHRWDYRTPIEERLSKPCMTWSRRARRCTSVRAACMPGNSPRRCIPPNATAGRVSLPCRTM